MFRSTRYVLVSTLLCLAVSVQAQVQLVLTEGGVEKTCTTVGDLMVAAGQVRATVQAGCLDAPAGGGGGGGGNTQYQLSVTVQGAGEVTSNPAGISCGTQCSASFASASSVVLTAVPASGSVLSGWSGCSSQSGASCTVTMASNRSVTATFTTQSGGGGGSGSDPRTPVWKPNATTYVFDRGAWTEQIVPRCVPDQYNNCRYGGSRSLYDTVRVGEVWSMRVPHGVGSELLTHTFYVARAETGESLNAYDISLSTTPGDFDNVSGACLRLNAGALTAYDPILGTPRWGTHCPMNRNTMYYLNVRPARGTPGETRCGTSAADACRFRIMLPPAFPYSN